jgi:hypothetical protein
VGVETFSHEAEILFPPLTYLQPTEGWRQVFEANGVHFTIVEVQPAIA